MKRSAYSIGLMGALALAAMAAMPDSGVAVERDPPREPIEPIPPEPDEHGARKRDLHEASAREGRYGRTVRSRDRIPADIQSEKIKRATEKRARKAKARQDGTQ